MSNTANTPTPEQELQEAAERQFQMTETAVSGCWELQNRVMADGRGAFVKLFHAPYFKALGLATDFVEQYYSRSVQGVLRGMHFQTPPADHDKWVSCIEGKVLDVILDLRQGSPTFGKVASLKLKGEQGNAVYIPKGCAHGFLTISPTATLLYNVTSVFSGANDAGLLWSSIPFEWPLEGLTPILSGKDTQLPDFRTFESPFVY